MSPPPGWIPLTRRAIIRHLQDLHARGKTLVLSSHRMGDIARVTDHTTVMQNGASILTGTTGGVFSQGETLLQAGLGAAPQRPGCRSSCAPTAGRCRRASPARRSWSRRCRLAWGGAHERFRIPAQYQHRPVPARHFAAAPPGPARQDRHLHPLHPGAHLHPQPVGIGESRLGSVLSACSWRASPCASPCADLPPPCPSCSSSPFCSYFSHPAASPARCALAAGASCRSPARE